MSSSSSVSKFFFRKARDDNSKIESRLLWDMQGETTSTLSYNRLPSTYSMISFLGEPTVQEEDDGEF